MPRLLGVEIPADKRIEASLTYIYGIGFSTARRILEQTNIDKRAHQQRTAQNRRRDPQSGSKSRQSLIKMAEHKKPAKPKAEKADKPKKPEAEDKSPAAEAKADQTPLTPAAETAAPVGAEAKPAKKPAKPTKQEAAPVEAPRENLTLDADEIEKPKIVKAKGAKNIHSGIAHVYATFNNTIVTI